MYKPGVLFLCTGNSARSQMAEALLRKEAGDQFEVYSAGTDPKGINPFTVQAMNERGLDLSGHRSKCVSELLGRVNIHTLIVVCDHADRACPTIWPGMRVRLFWPFDDPAACEGTDDERLLKFREVRDKIHDRIKDWLREQNAR